MNNAKLTAFDRYVLEQMKNAGYQYLAREDGTYNYDTQESDNFDGRIFFFTKKPEKSITNDIYDGRPIEYWKTPFLCSIRALPKEITCFSMVSASDEKPLSIDDLLSADAGTARYGEWFSVKTPPEKYEDEYDEPIPFYVWVDGLGEPYKAFFDGNMWWDGISEIDGVTHWMPLPKPPATDNNVGTKKEEESE